MGRFPTAVRVFRAVSRAGDSGTLADRIRLAVEVFLMPLVTREKVIQELDDIDRVRASVEAATEEADNAVLAYEEAMIAKMTAEATLEKAKETEETQLDYSLAVLRAYAKGTELPADLVDPTPEPVLPPITGSGLKL